MLWYPWCVYVIVGSLVKIRRVGIVQTFFKSCSCISIGSPHHFAAAWRCRTVRLPFTLKAHHVIHLLSGTGKSVALGRAGSSDKTRQASGRG